MRPNEVNNTGSIRDGYTPVRVKDKDSGKSFVINFVNSKVKGNQSEWTIKDGNVYDKDGKTIQDNIIEVTRYQAALIKAAAQGNYDDKYLDWDDLNGAGYADNAEKELQKAKSEYKLQQDYYLVPRDEYDTSTGAYKEVYYPVADATETGVISAAVVNPKGQKGQITIDLRQDQIDGDKSRDKKDPWWKFW